jgi:hypothetical protein
MTASEIQINGLRRDDDPLSFNSDILFFEALTTSSDPRPATWRMDRGNYKRLLSAGKFK